MRRRTRRWAGLALLTALLATTPLQASASDPGPALLMHPSSVPEDPHPVPVRVEVRGEAGTAYEVKDWIGSPDRQAAHAWNGSDWHRSDHYVRTVTTGPDGTWRGWVTVRPNPDSAGYEALVDEPDATGLHVRTRPAEGDGPTSTASVRVSVLDDANATVIEGRAEDAAYVAARDGDGGWAGIAPVAPDPRVPPAPATGTYRLPAPDPDREAVRLGVDGEALGPVREPDPPPLVLTRALPHAYGTGEPAEAVAVANAGNASAALAGVCLEASGRACLEDGTLAPGKARVVARNATLYQQATGAEARPYPPSPEDGNLTLPDGGGVLALTWHGTRLDALAYGNVTPPPAWNGSPLETPRPGEVLRRQAPAEPGTAGAGDWSGGTRLGQTRLDPVAVAVDGKAWAAVAPEDSYDLVAGLLEDAEERIQLEAYLLTSPSIAHALADALDRGVDVDLLVEGAPVGGRPPVEDRILGALSRRGADVATLSSTPGFRARYPALHAKAGIVDGETVLVSTENLAASGFPPGGTGGNRGWIVAVEDPGLAEAVDRVLEADHDPRSPDVHPVDASDRRLPPRPVAPPPEPPDPVDLAGAEARPVVAPDTARHPATVLGLLASAEDRIDVQLLSLETTFETGPNPYVEALLAAAERGVDVRVHLDATYVDEATGALENDAPRDALLAAARDRDLPLEVRLARGLDAEKVHTKGALVDGERVLVGSVNWVEPALTRNRELGLVLEAPAVAEVFQAAFDRDWRRSLPGAGVVPPGGIPGLGVLAAAAALVAAADETGVNRRSYRPTGVRRREETAPRGLPAGEAGGCGGIRGTRGDTRVGGIIGAWIGPQWVAALVARRGAVSDAPRGRAHRGSMRG